MGLVAFDALTFALLLALALELLLGVAVKREPFDVVGFDPERAPQFFVLDLFRAREFVAVTLFDLVSSSSRSLGRRLREELRAELVDLAFNLVGLDEAFVFEVAPQFETFRFDTAFAFVVEDRLVGLAVERRHELLLAHGVSRLLLRARSQTSRASQSQLEMIPENDVYSL